ncbi:hypothetical protein [Burkholderia ubonensis]|nr:hypothetical protein [Burkholderia ubonensis]
MTTNTRTLQLPAIGLGTSQSQHDDGVRAVNDGSMSVTLPRFHVQ